MEFFYILVITVPHVFEEFSAVYVVVEGKSVKYTLKVCFKIYYPNVKYL